MAPSSGASVFDDCVEAALGGELTGVVVAEDPIDGGLSHLTGGAAGCLNVDKGLPPVEVTLRNDARGL